MRSQAHNGIYVDRHRREKCQRGHLYVSLCRVLQHLSVCYKLSQLLDTPTSGDITSYLTLTKHKCCPIVLYCPMAVHLPIP